MGKILIVEDDYKSRKALVKLSKSINENIEVLEAESEKDARVIIESVKIDAFFLDIQLKESSGFELAEIIRSIGKYKFTPIVFITGMYDLRLEAYVKFQCYRYILKPYMIEEVKKVFEDIFEYGIEADVSDKMLRLKEKGVYYKLFERDILLVEYMNKKLFLTTNEERIEFTYYSLKKIYELLSEDFVQIHKSYIINKNYIEKIDFRQNTICLSKITDGIPIGKKYRSNLEGVD